MAVKLNRKFQAEQVERFITLSLKEKKTMTEIKAKILSIAPKNMSGKKAVDYLANFLLTNHITPVRTEQEKALVVKTLRRELLSSTCSGFVLTSGERTAKAKVAMLLHVEHVELLRYFYTKHESLISRAERIILFDELFTSDVYDALDKRQRRIQKANLNSNHVDETDDYALLQAYGNEF